MRSRGYYKAQTRYDRASGVKPCHGKRVNQDPQLILDVLENVRIMDDGIRNWNLEDSIHWILGLEAYVKDKDGTLTPKFRDNYIFRRGEIVLVDFFGHFGNELTYEHPAIVLADTYNGVIIAPISSSCYNDGVKYHVSLEKNISDLGNVKNNCGIKLEQSRFISKKRILQKFKRVTNSDKLNEIDGVLMGIMTPVSYQLMKDLQQKQNELSEDITKLNKKNEELLQHLVEDGELILEKEKEIERLNRRIQLLEQQQISNQQGESAS